MQLHKLRARIVSLALSAAMVTTMMPATVFAVAGDHVTLGESSVGEIQSFDKLEDRFEPSTGGEAPSHVYGLSVELNTPEEDLRLPDELTAMVATTTAPAGDEETTATKEEKENLPVTWSSDKEYKSDENGTFIYTAVLPEGYILADGVELPQIYVAVGRQARDARADAITVSINSATTAVSGTTLQAVIETNGGAAAVTSLKITAGKVTEADWKYLIDLTALTTFEIDSAVEAVANMPGGAFSNSIFPSTITSVTVPQVITIGNYAFSGCAKLTSVSLSKASSIGNSAFSSCAKLTSVSLPKASSIGNSAFNGCTALTSVSIPEETTIGNMAFYGCTALTSASIPEATSIGNSAFSGCTALTSASIPKAISIGNMAFRFCAELTSVSIPEATSIGNEAFDGCTKLATLKRSAVPPTTIGTDAFKDCPATRALGYLNADGTPLTGDALTTAQAAYKAAGDGDTTDNLWYGWMIGGSAVIKVSINGAADTVGDATLQAVVEANGGAAAVTSLKITAGKVTEADWNYLKSLTALETFEIASTIADANVANIPDGINSESIFPSSIVSVTVPQAITIGSLAFYYCTALTSASFPAATSIGKSAFDECAALTSTSFPAATNIGDSAFLGCIALTSASFPAATIIDDNAFYNCTKLTSASFPVATSIGDNAFQYSTKLAALNLGATPPTTVGTSAFATRPTTRALGYVNASGIALTGTDLTNAQAAYKAVNDGDIADDLWYGWTIAAAPIATISVTINGTAYAGNTLQNAISKLQGGVTAVTSLKITAGKVTEADWNYLSSLTALTTFEIESSIETTNVANIPDGNFEDPIFPKSITSVTVPQAITIGLYAFYKTSLVSASFPEVTTVGESALSTCPALTSVSFPKATAISQAAFRNCPALTSASFPAVESIGIQAFENCPALTSASFPAVKTIDIMAFYLCSKLATLQLGATPPTVGLNVFDSCPATRALGYVDTDGTPLTGDALTTAQAAYKEAGDGDTTDGLWYGWMIVAPAIMVSINGAADTVGGETLESAIGAGGVDATAVTSLKITAGKMTEADWKYLSSLTALTTFEIESAVATVANIPDGNFEDPIFPKSITSVTVPQAITIGDYAFRDCAALTSANFPAATSVLNAAFMNCAALTSADFPAATSIGSAAFYNCAALTSAHFPAVTSIGGNAFMNCAALATLQLGATPPPTVVDGAFRYCPATRALRFVNADGNALTGDALTTAQAAYKAVDDGNTADSLWYGWTISAEADVHTLTASAGAGGSISPSGTVTVNHGESKTFTISANSNYSISSVSVDGVSQGAISTYTFSNVTGDHTISATFSYNGGGGGGGGGSSSGEPVITTPPKGNTSAGGLGTPGKTVIDNPVGNTGSANTLAQAVNNAVAAGQSSTTSILNFTNYKALTRDGLKAINDAITKAVAGKNIQLNTRVQLDNRVGSAVVSRITVDPAKLSAVLPDKLGLGVYFDQLKDAKVRTVNSTFAKHFENKIVSVVYEQRGSLAVSAEFSAKLNLADTFGQDKQLFFYTYDNAKNLYSRIAAPGYWVDNNGYAHINAPLGGSIIITDKPLTQK